MTRGKRRQVVGVVVSDRMDKSVVVEIQRLVKQPLYKKYIRRRSRLMAHDEENTARIGDRVELVETRPLSKRKSWRILQVLMRAPIITRVAAHRRGARARGNRSRPDGSRAHRGGHRSRVGRGRAGTRNDTRRRAAGT